MRAVDSTTNLEEAQRDLAACLSEVERQEAAIATEMRRRRIGQKTMQPITSTTDLQEAAREVAECRAEVQSKQSAVASEATRRSAETANRNAAVRSDARRRLEQEHQEAVAQCRSASDTYESACNAAAEARRETVKTGGVVDNAQRHVTELLANKPGLYARSTEIANYEAELAMWQEQLTDANQKAADAWRTYDCARAERDRAKSTLQSMVDKAETLRSQLNPASSHLPITFSYDQGDGRMSFASVV